jgi:rubrerythrin
VTGDQSEFRETAVAFEDLAVAAYKEEAPRIRDPELLAAAIRIHSVEARHAAWIRHLAGALPAPDAFDEPKSRRQVRGLVASTEFVVAKPATRSSEDPSFIG